MATKAELKREKMYQEAVQRLELMKVPNHNIDLFLMNKEVDSKVVVDHEEKKVTCTDITEAELEMVREFEEERGCICYYLIYDEGLYPDGVAFPRYTLLYVDEHESDYQMIKEECIKEMGTVPAYVTNEDDPDCSEMTEIAFVNVKGFLINAS